MGSIRGWKFRRTRLPQLAAQPFTIAVWIHTEAKLDDVLGDVMSW